MPQAHENHCRGDQQRRSINDERGRQTQARGQAAQHRSAHRPDEKPRREQARDAAARVRRRDPDHQTQRRHREHRRPEPAERTEKQQLPIRLGEGTRTGGQRHDHQAADVDPPLPHPLHQQAGGRRGNQPHQRERGDDERRGADADTEVARILRKDRGDHAVAQRDHDVRCDQQPDFARQSARCWTRVVSRATVALRSSSRDDLIHHFFAPLPVPRQDARAPLNDSA